MQCDTTTVPILYYTLNHYITTLLHGYMARSRHRCIVTSLHHPVHRCIPTLHHHVVPCIASRDVVSHSISRLIPGVGAAVDLAARANRTRQRPPTFLAALSLSLDGKRQENTLTGNFEHCNMISLSCYCKCITATIVKVLPSLLSLSHCLYDMCRCQNSYTYIIYVYCIGAGLVLPFCFVH